MKTCLKYLLAINILLLPLYLSSCKKEAEDIDKTAALKNVTISYKGMTYEFLFPQDAFSGKPLDSLMASNPEVYKNPANYTVRISALMQADNTKSNASDAKFDGMDINLIMDTITSSPIKTTAAGFEIKKDSIKPVTAIGSINLKTHKRTGYYMFKQIVDGADLATTMEPVLYYKIGIISDKITLPQLHQNIPTRATVPDGVKNFLKDLLNSEIFAGM